jgi:hypothetical protein
MRKAISTIAREELELARSHGSKPTEAIASLAARAKQDPRLYRQLMDPWLMDACRRVIEQEHVTARQRL